VVFCHHFTLALIFQDFLVDKSEVIVNTLRVRFEEVFFFFKVLVLTQFLFIYFFIITFCCYLLIFLRNL